MKLRMIALSTVLFAGGAFAAGSAYQAPVKPAKEHELLKHLVGNWDAVVDMMGSKEPGSMTTTLGMDGLWTVSDYKGTTMGMPFIGHEVMGYDSAKKKYLSCWVDSSSTNMTLTEGTWDEATKTLIMSGKVTDPAMGEMSMVSKLQVPDADHHIYSMHMGAAETPPVLTITYTRKK